MGLMEVPETALYGASTARAVLNFPISGTPLPPPLIHALGLIKWAAAAANSRLGKLDPALATLIRQAADEVASGALDAHFPIDVFQTGSGTSSNMNANEVIANRVSLLAGEPLGSKVPVHPNDHVNCGQSSNDVFPSAIHVAAAVEIQRDLLPAIHQLHAALAEKAKDFADVIKIGRTHLMDATPVTLGQEFGGYARQFELALARAGRARDAMLELPLGGTAVGTGINTHPEFASLAIAELACRTGIAFREAADHFEAQSARDAAVEASGLLKTIAVSLFKFANDLRLLGSGPRCGLGEIQLPATQPGSSIMPGKVNPVLAESAMQVATQVMANDAAIAFCAASGNLELNVMMPAIARNLLENIRLLAAVCRALEEKCVRGLAANRDRCAALVEESLAMVTSLAPVIGYDQAAAIAKQSTETGQTIRELCIAHNILPRQELDRLLDPLTMLAPSA